jgi:hypothetical protein
MTAESLLSQIRSLELELAVLKAALKRSGAATPAKTAADLYGICPSDTPAEALEAVKYRAKWDEPANGGGPA